MNCYKTIFSNVGIYFASPVTLSWLKILIIYSDQYPIHDSRYTLSLPCHKIIVVVCQQVNFVRLNENGRIERNEV